MFKFTRLSKDVRKPSRTRGSSFEVFAASDVDIPPFSAVTVNFGVVLEFPKEYFAHVWHEQIPGLASIGGVVDSDYRGEVGALLVNRSSELIRIRKNDPCGMIQFNEICIGDLVETA